MEFFIEVRFFTSDGHQFSLLTVFFLKFLLGKYWLKHQFHASQLSNLWFDEHSIRLGSGKRQFLVQIVLVQITLDTKYSIKNSIFEKTLELAEKCLENYYFEFYKKSSTKVKN